MASATSLSLLLYSSSGFGLYGLRKCFRSDFLVGYLNLYRSENFGFLAPFAMAGFAISHGMLKKVEWLLFQCVVVLASVAINIDAELPNYLSRSPSLSPLNSPPMMPAIPELPLPANLPLFHRHHRKHFSPHRAPSPLLVPAQPPNYGSLTTSGHPPSSPRLSKPSMKRNQSLAPSNGVVPLRLVGIAPTHSNIGGSPSGIAQPPLSPHFSDCCQPNMVLKRGSWACHCVYPIKIDLKLLNVSLSSNWSPFL